MRYLLITVTLLFAACDKPVAPKIAEPQREALDKAKAVEQVVQQNAEGTRQGIEEAE